MLRCWSIAYLHKSRTNGGTSNNNFYNTKKSCTTLYLKVPLQWATCLLDTECHLLPCSHDKPAIGELLVKLCDAFMKIKSETFKPQQNHNWGIQTWVKPEEQTLDWDLSTLLCHGWCRHLLSPKAPQLRINKLTTQSKHLDTKDIRSLFKVEEKAAICV